MVKIASLPAILAIATLAYSPLQAQERPSLAVFPAIIPATAQPFFAEGKLDAQELTQQIEEALRGSRRFAIFERSEIILQNSVLVEQEFAKGGQALRNAAEAGKLANVQFIAQPKITQVNISVRKNQNEENPGQYRYSVKGFLSVRVKVLDTTSAEIAFQTTRDVALRPDNDVGMGQNGAHDEFPVLNAAWRSLTNDAAARLVNAVVGSLSPIRVLQAQDADIFVN